jgi:FkbM family methyltransferase
MINIGVHKGEEAIEYALAGWSVICIEANPDNYSSLIEHIDFASKILGSDIHNQIQVVHAAVTADDSVDEIDFFVHPLQTGAGSLDDRSDGFDKIRVPAITLRQLLNKHKINKIDYLLIDAEGHDLNIFESLTSDEHLKSCTLEFTYGNIERMCGYATTLELTSYEIFVYHKDDDSFWDKNGKGVAKCIQRFNDYHEYLDWFANSDNKGRWGNILFY